ncbi:Two-component response regulator ORR4 [Dichanthelium oligosanthes]|uniref:Two-component response regulator ORR4 n=1 Tax=Dichanthelium oligosanthes TaxID=888268 RepID=A0A1E5WK03_9POAL|nr:Two-component response regulator ORR4 [Dichanthelium oligosanthes]
MTVVDAESRFHVLAVDDSLIDRKLIEMLLKNSSYQVTTVDSGSKALELLGLRDEVDDASSPSSSSPDHQGSSSLKDIPVVIMSSENVPARINRCLEDGAEEFFLKPVKLADMKKLKSHLLKRKQPTKCQPQIQPEPEQKLEPPQPAHKPEEAVAVVTADGTVISDCNGSSNKRKAAAMEQQQEGLTTPESTKPRLSNSSLAVET